MKRLQTIAEIIVIFLLSLTPVLWLRPGEIVLGHDSGFRLDPFGYLRTLWYSWDQTVGYGADVNGSKGFLIAQLPEAIFVRLTHSLTSGQTLSFIFWFFVIGISMYVCVRAFFPDRKYWIMRLLSSAGYMYNLFLLQGWFITERAKFSLFAAIPLVFVICVSTLRGTYSILKGSILFALTLFVLNGGGSPPLYGGILITVSVLVLFDITVGMLHRQGIKRLWRAIRMVVSMVLCTAFVNAYWIVPLLYQVLYQYETKFASVGGFGGIMAWESYVSILASFSNLFRLQGLPDWYNNRFHPYAAFYNQPQLIFFSLLPVIGFVYVLLRRDWHREWKHVYFVLGPLISIWFISMIFTAGSHSPLGFIYTAFLKYVPGFTIFRTSYYKFGSALWFSSIFLFSFSATLILAKHIQNKVLYGFAAVALFIGLLLFHYPYFFSNFFKWNAPFTTKVQVPGYVQDMLSYINSAYGEHKQNILLLPPLDTGFHADGYAWGFWSLDVFTRLGLSSPTVANDTDLPIVRALYDAISDGNMNLVTKLAKQCGITKILWRGDVLYSDKVTGSTNYSYMKKVLDESSQATEEKRFGKWTLYALKDIGDVQKIRAANVIVQADVPGDHRSGVFALKELQALPVVFTGDAPQPVLAPMTRFWAVSAQCVYCDPSDLRKIEQMKIVSEVNFLPDSPMYGLSAMKEEWVLHSFARTPKSYIDANIGYATKHLAEVSTALVRNADNMGSLIEISFENFQRRIETALQTINTLPEKEENAARLRFASYLRMYVNYLIDLEKIDYKGQLSENFLGNAYQYLQKQIAAVSRGTWISDESVSRYYISIPADGMYTLTTSGSSLPAGIHKLETLTSGESTASGDINLSYKDAYTVNIAHMSDRELYLFRFEYQVRMGDNVFVKILQDNDIPDQYGNPRSPFVFGLLADGKWHVVEEVVRPNRAVSSGRISFYSANTQDQVSTVSLKNVSFTNIQSKDIFALKSSTVPEAKLPAVTSEEINADMYQVHVEGAVSPYILIFNQQYDSGWRVYRGAPGQKIWNMKEIKTPHFAVNGYENAWYMDQAGSYDIVILYFPHLLFLLSVGITGISLISSVIVLFYEKYRRIYR